MEWLLYEGEKVFLHKLILQDPVVIRLQKKFKEEKFDKFLVYVYLCYHPDSPYAEFLMSERKEAVYSRYVGGKDWREFEDDLDAELFIQGYRKSSLTTNEQLYLKWKEDVDGFVSALTEIKYHTIDKDGQKVPNIELKSKALKTAAELVEYGKSLEARIVKERSKRENRDTRRLFDKR